MRSKSEDFGWVQRVTELQVELRWMKCSCQFLNKELNTSKIIIYLIEHFILFKFHGIKYVNLVGILTDLVLT